MTLPTFISALRIALAFVIMVLLSMPESPAKVAALICFLVASASDWLDGYLARKLKQTSALGALLDPIADKILTLGIFVVYAYQALVPWWMVFVIATREIVITAIRVVAAQKKIILAASSEGKHKMVSQVVAILALLIFSILHAWPAASPIPVVVLAWVQHLVALSLWVAVVLTVISGSFFFFRHRSVLLRLAALR